MSFYWLEKGWKDKCCARCGKKIYPEGDPDWGLCYDCFSDDVNRRWQIDKSCKTCFYYEKQECKSWKICVYKNRWKPKEGK